MDEIRASIQRKMNTILDVHLDSLLDIWKDIGLGNEAMLERVETLCAIAGNLLSRAVSEAKNKKIKLMESVEKHGALLFEISKELSNTAKEPNENLTLIELEKFLIAELTEAKAEKAARLDKLDKLRAQEKSLTTELASLPLPLVYNIVPSKAQLTELEMHNDELIKIKEQRSCTFYALKSIITRLMEELEITSKNSPEFNAISEKNCSLLTEINLTAVRDLRDALEKELQSNTVKAEQLRKRLSELGTLLQLPTEEVRNFIDNNRDHYPSTINQLQKEIEKYEKRKMEHLKVFVTNIREQLHIYWDRCCYSQSQKETFQAYYDDNFTEVLLQTHEEELRRIQDFYTKSQEIFAKIAKRNELWSKMLELQRNAKDTERFNNRGGKLLQEERERKKLMVQIPKLETELAALTKKWETEHGSQFLVYGLPIADHIAKQWESYEEEKENERLARQYAKAKLLQTELANGSKPCSSGAKRPRVCTGTPASNRASKVAKVGTPLPLSSLTSSMKRGQNVDIHSIFCNTPLGKPPKSSSKDLDILAEWCSSRQLPLNMGKVLRAFLERGAGQGPNINWILSKKPKCIPRRLLHRSGTSMLKVPNNYVKAKHSFSDESKESKAGMQEGGSTLSTYSQFQLRLDKKCRRDIFSRSSTVTPQTPVPNSPRRLRGDLGLPILM